MPRPNVCVRRAWHSDRHQPMRASIIQQLLKVLYESHGPITRKNMEWQNKLPVVVLKAEEIMYSKANCEAEYKDFQTLWERVNDAVNTIIRIDEKTETDDCLPPCVEAGLKLGCVPVKVSRSQRHTSLRSYLGPEPDEPVYSSKITKNFTNNQNDQLTHHLVNQSNQHHPSPCLSIKSRKHVLTRSTCTFSTSSNVGSVDPLHNDVQFRKHHEKTPFPSQIQNISNPIIMCKHVFPSMTEPPIISCFQSLVSEINVRNIHEKESETRCDLSLRLGSCNKDTTNKELDNEIKKEFLLFSGETSNDPSGFGTSRWSFEGEGDGVGPAMKKTQNSYLILIRRMRIRDKSPGDKNQVQSVC